MFDRLEPKELFQVRASIRGASPENQLDSALTDFYLFENASLRGDSATADAKSLSVQKFCESQDQMQFQLFKGQTKTRAKYLCIINGVEGDKATGLPHVQRLKTVARLLPEAQSEEFTFEERAAVEGRIFLFLRKGEGQSIGKARLAFESLARLRPDLKAPPYFLALTYGVQGRESEEDEQLMLLSEKGNTRAKLRLGTYSSADKSSSVSEEPGRFFWGVVAGPTLGVGARVGYLQPENSEGSGFGASIYGASESVGGVDAFWNNGKLLKPLQIRLAASADYGNWEFYGLGMESLLLDIVSYKGSRLDFSGGLRWKVSSIYFGVGGVFYGQHTDSRSLNSAFDALVFDSAYGFGPYGEMGLDIPSFRGSPWTRARLSYSAFSVNPRADTFSELRFTAEQGFWLRKQQLRFHLAARQTSELVPFGQLSRLGGSFAVPGVRPGRFQERSMIAGWFEWAIPVWSQLSLVPFGTFGGVNDEISKVPEVLSGGFGGAIEYLAGRAKTRLEAGSFQGEWTLQALVAWH